MSLCVDIEKERADQIILRFMVQDTGIGVPEHKLGNLFQPFTQVDASVTRKFGGTGLGLAISKNLDGEIAVESEDGKGARFCFTICMEK